MKRHQIIKFLLCAFLVSSAVINFLSALSPETGFDALWYHLTLPKLYLEAGKIYHVPGGLLYYSAMPRLAEFLYLPLLKLIGDTGPHLLNWLAGLGTAAILYKISRKYLNQMTSLLVTSLWYVTPLVGWQSGSAYVDLIRTFFEVLAFYLIVQKRIIWAGIAIGLAVSTKTLALGTLPILALVAWLSTKKLLSAILLSIIALVVCFPWFFGAYTNTGFPFYPIGAGVLDQTHGLNFDFWHLPRDYLKLFLLPSDIISPIYVLFLPFLFFVRHKKSFNLFITFFLFSLLVWFITPRTGGGRFILPHLPVWSVFVGLTVYWQKNVNLRLLLTCLILGAIMMNLGYRSFAVSRNIPYLLGHQTKEDYLCNRLDFTLGNFVDCDGFFKKTIKSTDLVLIKDIHNLYYVNFPFVHESWYKGEKFNYILTQKPITKHKLIYRNSHTNVYLYKK